MKRTVPLNWVDLFAAGPATLISWTSSYSETGVLGEAELATAEKGQRAYEEAVKQLARFIDYFKDRPLDVRQDHHTRRPTMPLPGAASGALMRADCIRPRGCRAARRVRSLQQRDRDYADPQRDAPVAERIEVASAQ